MTGWSLASDIAIMKPNDPLKKRGNVRTEMKLAIGKVSLVGK